MVQSHQRCNKEHYKTLIPKKYLRNGKALISAALEQERAAGTLILEHETKSSVQCFSQCRVQVPTVLKLYFSCFS